MASFSLDYSSSEEDPEAQPSRFNIGDLPSLQIPFPFQSDSSDFEIPESPGTSRPVTPATPSSPGTPLSPTSSLGGAFSYIDISSQTSDGATLTPQPPLVKKYIKKKSGPLKKGQQPLRPPPVSDSPAFKRYKVERPKTPMFSEMRFPLPVTSYSIKTVTGENTIMREVILPTGNAICNLDILSHVFSQLCCIDRSSYGKLRLYETMIRDGLQSFLLLKCFL